MRLRHTCCAYAASYLACWPTLQRVCPALCDVDFATTELPSVAAARDAYEAIRACRSDVAAIYSEFDKDVYHLLDGEARARYRPAALPPASRLLPASRLFKPDDDDSIPTPPSQKALSAVLNHHRWLELLDKAHDFDSTAIDTPLDHREATRLRAGTTTSAPQVCAAAPVRRARWQRAVSATVLSGDSPQTETT